jgi:hypothetical protein
MASDAMSSRERLRAALAGEPTDRVPWSPCVDGERRSPPSAPSPRRPASTAPSTEIASNAAAARASKT